MMYYDLNKLEQLSNELGLKFSRPASETLEIIFRDDVTLVFMNILEEEDTYIGFKGTRWHTHGTLMLMIDDARYLDLDELDIVQGIKAGDILICESYLKGVLNDRWLIHKDEKMDVRYIQSDEEMRIWRLPQ